MKITKIEKKKHLYLVEIDDKNHLYVTQDTIARYLLSKDKQLSQELLAEIKDFARLSSAKNLALYYLSFKQRSETEVRNYLKKHEHQDKVIAQVIAELKDAQWLDDRKYAEALIRQNINTGDKGAYLLKQKLLQKGIESSVIDQELSQVDFGPLVDKVSQKLLKKYQNKLPQGALQNKIIHSLTAKGFGYQEAKNAFDALDIEHDNDMQETLINKEMDKAYRRYSKKYEGYALKQHITQNLARKGFSLDTINKALRNLD
ncbi:recombination regulator RecX [Streptococcus sp. H31]|uniref:recombination regulator RecX n=1 Tax=Streptococcus huangxiaojuni TaxID=3237239 RepID=UPI0034A1E76B